MRQISLLLALLALVAPEFRATAAPPPPRAIEVPAAPRPADSQSILRNGDVFEMRITGVDPAVVQEFTNSQYTIGSEGTVRVTYIGQVQAAGLTPTQLAASIEAKFIAGKIFTTPTVNINVAQVQRFVSVSGGVRAPQRLQWLADMTLSSAIGNCQGLSDFGEKKGVQLIRDGKVQGVYNLNDIDKNPALDPKLLPGDQVKVRGQ